MDTRSGPETCVAYRSLAPARDLCGVPCRDFNRIKSPQLAVCYMGPWMFCGGCWLYVICVRDQVVLDATQVHHVGKVYKLYRDKIYLDSRACGLRHAMLES